MMDKLKGWASEMKVTVCELGNDPAVFARDWKKLADHAKTERSDLILLPEMPFFPWFAWSSVFEPSVWRSAVQAHQDAFSLLEQLAPAFVCGSRPVDKKGKRQNEAFVWEKNGGFRTAHTKHYLPDEEDFWEASWYERGEGHFLPIQVGEAHLGFLICSDIWFFHHARSYGKKGVHLIACPRATPRETLDKWVAGGQAAAVVSGAFALSSNRIGQAGEKTNLGGQGWIVDPDGKVLGLTSREHPFLTLDLDLQKADQAKRTYPRYIED